MILTNYLVLTVFSYLDAKQLLTSIAVLNSKSKSLISDAGLLDQPKHIRIIDIPRFFLSGCKVNLDLLGRLSKSSFSFHIEPDNLLSVMNFNFTYIATGLSEIAVS